MALILPLDSIFGAPANVKVLRVLDECDFDLTGRQVASLAGLNAMTCLNSLNRLREADILKVRPAGRANLYELNPENPVVKELILPVFRKERAFRAAQLGILVARLKGIAAALILVQRDVPGEPVGKGDICIIVPTESAKEFAGKKASEEIGHLERRLAEVPGFMVVALQELRELKTIADPLFDAILQGTLLYGTAVDRLAL